MHFRFILTLMAAIATYLAANAEAKPDSVHLNEVKVVGYVAPYAEVIPAQKLTGKQLERLNSFSVADAIRYFSGVQIKDYGGVGGIKTVDIRSMGTNHMGVFYDGIQLGNAQNGQINLGKFSLDNIEEISLYNGQKSEIFQSAKDFGSAGTIYLRTRYPHFEGTKNTNLQATFRTGSFGLVNPSLRWEQKISNSVSASISTEFIYATGRYKFRYKKIFSDGTVAWDTTATRHNGDITSFRAEAGLFGLISGGRWNAKAYFYDSEKGIPGAIVNNVWKASQRQWDRNFFAQGSLQKQITGNYQLLINAKYAKDYMRYLNPDTTLMYINNKFWQQEAYISTANKFTIAKNWDVDLSADYQWNYLSSTLTEFAYPTRHTALVALATAYQWWKLKGQASILGTYVFDRSRVTNGSSVTHQSSDRHEYTPAIFLSYQPFTRYAFTVRAFYKRIFRMPTFNDLYYTDIGNAKLNPEFATQYNLGFQYHVDFASSLVSALSLRADAYYNRVTDKIIAVPKGTGQYRWMMMNIGKVKIRGIDVTAQVDFHLPEGILLNANLNYTYQKAQDYTNPADNEPGAGSYKGQIAYIPWNSGSAVVHGSYRHFDLNYSFIYVGERYHNSANIRENYEQPWYTHDISAGYDFKIGAAAIKVIAEVNNLLNQQYDVILNYPMPGRNYKLTFKINI
ncbi:MAG: TonB-dependent receptor [Muribaculaceae bacterium]|jgi:vitamin B12 transporter|nr:TonB-dependent receptor [Muribaculaceae bacterium]